MVEPELVRAIARASAGSTSGGVVEVQRDELDGSLWVRMVSGSLAREAAAALEAYGLGVVDRDELGPRLQVTGWDVRLLRRRLACLLGGVDDLKLEWDATAELARYHRDRRTGVTGVDADPVEVLADVERTLRAARPIGTRAPWVEDVAILLQLVDAAEDAYAELIERHLDHAAGVLEADAETARVTRPGI